MVKGFFNSVQLKMQNFKRRKWKEASTSNNHDNNHLSK